MFVCHASEDAAVARRLVEVLEAAGVPCWIAPRDISPGSEYTQAILDGLAAAPALLLVFSRAANLSPHVRRELEVAVATDTRLFPLRLEDVEPSASLRYFIGTWQWLDTVGTDRATWEPALVAGVRRLLGGDGSAPEPPEPPEQPTSAEPAQQPSRRPRPAGTTWGRDLLRDEVLELLGGEEPLVTLTGLGGIGKTHLATDVAAAFPDLEVLDDTDPRAVELRLTAAPDRRVLATSRLPLGLPVERVVAVPPLDPEASLRLFSEVAARSAPRVDLAAQATRVAELCAFLGGIPLGLVLAATRLRVVGLDRLHQGLSTSLDLVADLAAALQGSLDHLDDGPRALAEALSVFGGPVPFEGVEAVAPGPRALDELTALVESGLVQVEERDGECLYALPHPVRLLARRALENGPRAEEAQRAAAAYLLTEVTRWRAQLDSAAGPEVLEAFCSAAPDVEAAVDAAALAGDADLAVDLVSAADQLWIAAGRNEQGRQLCLRVLATLPAEHPRAARLRAAVGLFAYHLSDWATAEAELRAALEEAEATGDDVAAATARCYLSGTLLMSGRVEEGSRLAARVYAETEALGLYPQAAEGLFMLALSRLLAGDVDGEREAHERRLAVVRRHGDVARTADQLNTLAEIALDDRDPDKARRYAEESLALARERLPSERRDATITAARAAAALGDWPGAGRLLGDALALSGELGQALATAQCLRVAGLLAGQGGEPALAVRLFAAAQALSPSVTGTDDPPEVDLAEALARARAALEEREVEREWTLGGALPLTTMLGQLDQAVALSGP